MNKCELIDKAVIIFDGVWPSKAASCVHMESFLNKETWCCSNCNSKSLFTKDEFKQRARELGYINGYRWGVEYNLSRSAISDLGDIRITLLDLKADAEDIMQDGEFSRADLYNKFKITDERYKPADTSYLNSVSEISESKSNAENVSDWYDYEAQKAVALPPVGLICEAFNYQRDEWVKVKTLEAETKSKELACVTLESEGYWGWLFWGCKFRPLDHAMRKAEAEKKRVVDAAVKLLEVNHGSPWSLYVKYAESLYDAGFLRMPAE